MRAFFAVDLPESLASAVAAAQAPFANASGVNPIDPEQAHVTLKFCGEVSDVGDEVGDVGGEVGDGDAPPALDDVVAAGTVSRVR